MKKYLFMLVVVLLNFSCTQEESDLNVKTPYPNGLHVSADFIDLAAAGNIKQAGILTINSDQEEVKVKWITDSSFNLDTTQTSIIMKDGKGILPIQWQEKLENDAYAPENIWFKAGVLLTAGEDKCYIPLYQVNKLDSAKIMKSVRTRAENIDALNAASIQILPPQPSMGENGATVFVKLTNLTMVLVDYSSIKQYHNINMDEANLPVTLNLPMTQLKFNWKDPNVRPPGFSLPINFYAFELIDNVSFNLTWDPGTPPGTTDDLSYLNDDQPTGNIPVSGGRYTFNFQGTYTGNVQVAAYADGGLLVEGTRTTNKQSVILIPENTSDNSRTITYKYKTDNSEWLALPATTTRVQSSQTGSGGMIKHSPITPEDAVIPDAGKTYSCTFYDYTGAIKFRAVKDGETASLVEVSGTCPTTLSLVIPELVALADTKINFEYSIDNGVTWVFMESKMQVIEQFGMSAIQPVGNLPAAGGTFTAATVGNYTGIVIIRAISNGVELFQSRGAVPGTINLPVPANTTGRARFITFSFNRNGGNAADWHFMETRRQLAQ